MKTMWPAYYVGSDGTKFPYGEHTVDTDPRYMHGRKSLPAEGWPYTIEFAYNFGPKHSDGDELKDIVHNLMCFYHYEDIDTLSELKARAKNGMEAYPNHFPYRFMVSAINLITQEAASWCNEFKKGIFEHPLKDKLTDVAIMMAMREETGLGADVVTKVLKAMMDGMDFADAYEKSLPVMVAEGELEVLVREVMAENAAKVEEYKKGKKGIASMFVGLVMKKKKGLDAREVVKTIEQELNKP